MKSEMKQLEIIERQITIALQIVERQKNRYEELMEQLCGYKWNIYDDADKYNEIANGIVGALGNLESIIENIYK